MLHNLALTGGLTLLVCALPVQKSTQQDQGTQKLILEAGEHSVYDLVRRSGEFLNRSYSLDLGQCPSVKTDVSSRIELSRRLELDASSCEEVIGGLLWTKGWLALPVDAQRGIYDWVWQQGPKGADIRSHVVSLPADAIRRRPKVIDYVATTLQLKHSKAQVTAANMRTFFNDPRGLKSIIPVGQNGLMITGIRPQVATVIALCEKLDVPGATAGKVEARLQAIERRLQALERKQK